MRLELHRILNHLNFKPAFLNMSLSCFSTTFFASLVVWSRISPYLPVAPQLWHLIIELDIGLRGISNNELPQEHLTVIVLLDIRAFLSIKLRFSEREAF